MMGNKLDRITLGEDSTRPAGRKHAQASGLFDGALDGMAGPVVFSDVYDVDPADAEAFDRGFPPKEKKFQESQRAFERAAQELDE